MLSMVRRCITVKVGGSPKNEKKENRGKFINFAEIMGKYAISIIGLGGWVPPHRILYLSSLRMSISSECLS